MRLLNTEKPTIMFLDLTNVQPNFLTSKTVLLVNSRYLYVCLLLDMFRKMSNLFYAHTHIPDQDSYEIQVHIQAGGSRFGRHRRAVQLPPVLGELFVH